MWPLTWQLEQGDIEVGIIRHDRGPFLRTFVGAYIYLPLAVENVAVGDEVAVRRYNEAAAAAVRGAEVANRSLGLLYQLVDWKRRAADADRLDIEGPGEYLAHVSAVIISARGFRVFAQDALVDADVVPVSHVTLHQVVEFQARRRPGHSRWFLVHDRRDFVGSRRVYVG